MSKPTTEKQILAARRRAFKAAERARHLEHRAAPHRIAQLEIEFRTALENYRVLLMDLEKFEGAQKFKIEMLEKRIETSEERIAKSLKVTKPAPLWEDLQIQIAELKSELFSLKTDFKIQAITSHWRKGMDAWKTARDAEIAQLKKDLAKLGESDVGYRKSLDAEMVAMAHRVSSYQERTDRILSGLFVRGGEGNA